MATETKKFGVSKREGHDSSAFYNRKLYNTPADGGTKSTQINQVPTEYLNSVQCKDSRNLDFLPDNCIHLMVTSPPYNVGKEYEEDLALQQYLELLKDVMAEIYRVLVPGGRACINIANVGRKPYIPLNNFINQIMIDLGFLMRGEIIWDKAASAGGSCAWGSWQSASNPVLRDVHEYILVFSKDSFMRTDNSDKEKENTIGRDEFLEYTKSIWQFNTESARRVNHPAPFPVELPYRLLQLYTFQGDIVIDPFCGSGTTCVAALKTNRGFIGIDHNQDYANAARTRLDNYQEYQEDVVSAKELAKAKAKSRQPSLF